MTNLQMSIMEAMKDDLISSNEAASMFNIVTEGSEMFLADEYKKILYDNYKKVVADRIADIDRFFKNLDNEYKEAIRVCKKYPNDDPYDHDIYMTKPTSTKIMFKTAMDIKDQLINCECDELDDTIKCYINAYKGTGKDMITDGVYLGTSIFGGGVKFKHAMEIQLFANHGYDKVVVSRPIYTYLFSNVDMSLQAFYSEIQDEADCKYPDPQYYAMLLKCIKESKIVDKLKYAYMLPLNLK